MSSTRLSACASRARMYWLRKSLFPSADSHLKTVALSGISTSAQIARRFSLSAMRLQISSPSSVVNNDGRPIGRFRGSMGLDQFVRRAHLGPYYASRACGARVRPRSRSNRDSSPEVRFGSAQCTRETASGDRTRVVRGDGALSGMLPLAGGFQAAAKIGKHFVWHWLAHTLRREMPSGISAFGNDVDIRTIAYMPSIAADVSIAGSAVEGMV